MTTDELAGAAANDLPRALAVDAELHRLLAGAAGHAMIGEPASPYRANSSVPSPAMRPILRAVAAGDVPAAGGGAAPRRPIIGGVRGAGRGRA